MPENNIYNLGFNNFLTKEAFFVETVESSNLFTSSTPASLVASGDLTGNLTMSDGFMQSSNFVTGVSGWKIDKDGNVEFESGYFRGDITGASGAFSGTVSASNITSGTMTSKTVTLAISDGTGDVYFNAGKTDFTNVDTGFILGLDDSDSNKAKLFMGSSSVYFNWDGTNVIIVGGTITGATVQTATSGRRTRMTGISGIEFLNNDSQEGYIYNDGSGNMIIDADNLVTIRADGAGDDVSLIANDLVYSQSDILWNQCDAYRTLYCDNYFCNYNDDNVSGLCYWVDRGDNEMKLDSGGNLFIDGTYTDGSGGGADFAEYFESIDGKEIPVGTTVVNEGDKIRPAKNGERPIGSISATATFLGNSGGSNAGTNWTGKYVLDEFGRRIEEEAEWWSIKEKKSFIKKTGQKYERDIKRSNWSDIEKPPKGANIKMAKREKINPEWNPKQKYKPRKDRPEWNIVGLVGRVRILKGQPVNNNWIKLKDISENVEEWLIK